MMIPTAIVATKGNQPAGHLGPTAGSARISSSCQQPPRPALPVQPLDIDGDEDLVEEEDKDESDVLRIRNVVQMRYATSGMLERVLVGPN
jgi:hypothetical protein